jgi:HAD superfamily hydrolase (TIGR01549 family)
VLDVRGSLGRRRRQWRLSGADQPFVGDDPQPTPALTLFSVVVFDLDGTLLDSDEALAAPFAALGVPRSAVTFGHVVADECARLGLSLDEYLAHYDVSAAQPYPGVDELLARLPRWAVCSNKHPKSGVAEIARLGWKPEVALFASDFGGGPKELGPVLERLGAPASEVVFVGDTDHDRSCAAAVEVAFGLAAWNRRAEPRAGDFVLQRPADLLELVATR